MRRHIAAIALLAVVAATMGLSASGPAGARPRVNRWRAPDVEVQLLALNDFHGNLEASSGLLIDPATGSGSSSNPDAVPAGGVEYLASRIRGLQAGQRNSVVVSAGDLVGASPLLSALFHDEPTIEAMNRIGLDLNAVGNHEFDEGSGELRRLQDGGCHPVDGCQDGDGFGGADFSFLSANVVDTGTGRSFFPRYAVKQFNGAKVGFIGMTLEGTPSIVTPSGVAGLDFLDEADTVNAIVPELRRQGVQSIVVLVHEGGFASGGINGCEGASGPIIDIVDRLDDEVDAVISGHTHQAYNCNRDGKLLTSASSFGRLVTDVSLSINRRTGDVRSIEAENLVVDRNRPPAVDLTALLDEYRPIAEPLANRVIGTASALLSRTPTASGESPLGNLIADAQRAATDADGAFMNTGGVRADIEAGEVTYGESFTVQPFGNSLVTVTLTGAQIDTLLEQQFCQPPTNLTRILNPSATVAYSYSSMAACGNKVNGITIDDVGVSSGNDYRVTVNSFLADGGDGFAVLRDGTDRIGGDLDLDALEASFQAAPGQTLDPPATDRITVLP